MSSANAPLPQTLPAADPGDWSRPLAERQLAILGRIAEAGLEIVVALEAQAKGGEVVVQGDLAMAFNRVARAVRHTLMLQARLVEALKDHEAGRASLKADLNARAARLVRGAIEDDGEARADAGRAERLAAEAAERLRAEDIGDLLTRPFGEAVAGICRDLGLSPDWLALAEDCYAAEAEAGFKPGKAPEPDAYAGALEVQWLPPRSSDSS